MMGLLTSVVFVVANLYCLCVGVLEVAVSASLQIPSFCSTDGGVTIGTWLIVDGPIIICYASLKFVKRYQELTCDSSEPLESRANEDLDAAVRAAESAEEKKEETHSRDMPYICSSPHFHLRFLHKSRAGGLPSKSSLFINVFSCLDLLVDLAMVFKFAWVITGTVLLWKCVQYDESSDDMVRIVFTLAVTQTYIFCAIKLAQLFW